MKAIKYLVIGAMIGISAPSMAQDVDYGTALAPVTQALKSKAANADCRLYEASMLKPPA